MRIRRLFFPDGDAPGGGGDPAATHAPAAKKVAEAPVIGAPVAGKAGWFHPGPGDTDLADSATHTADGDKNPYIKIGGLWRKTTVADIDRLGLAGLAKS